MGMQLFTQKTAMPWSLDCRFLEMRLRMTEQLFAIKDDGWLMIQQLL